MIEVPHASDATMTRPVPCWWGGIKDMGKEARTALMKCPNGHIGSLLDHTIANDGIVSPSVVCSKAGCGFHDKVKLTGWTA